MNSEAPSRWFQICGIGTSRESNKKAGSPQPGQINEPPTKGVFQ
jgi:hypothetical protein